MIHSSDYYFFPRHGSGELCEISTRTENGFRLCFWIVSPFLSGIGAKYCPSLACYGDLRSSDHIGSKNLQKTALKSVEFRCRNQGLKPEKSTDVLYCATGGRHLIRVYMAKLRQQKVCHTIARADCCWCFVVKSNFKTFTKLLLKRHILWTFIYKIQQFQHCMAYFLLK